MAVWRMIFLCDDVIAHDPLLWRDEVTSLLVSDECSNSKEM
jgi:hypothetical protein